MVFIILVRKASRLRPDIVLEGWLHETARLTALAFQRDERRRQFREQEAYMQSILQETGEDSIWMQLAPLLDEALSRLGKKDRDAVVTTNNGRIALQIDRIIHSGGSLTISCCYRLPASAH